MDPLNSSPLQSIETEMAYLGSLLFDNRQIPDTAAQMHRAVFASPKHQVIFDAVMRLFTRGSKVELVLLRDELDGLKSLTAVGGAAYLMALVDGVPNAEHASEYAKTLLGLWQRRTLVRMLDEIKVSVVASPSFGETFDGMGVINRAIQAIGDSQGGEAVIFLEKLLSDALHIQPPASANPTVTRIGKIDGNINLFTPGELTIVAARPSVGKSSFMRQVCANAADSGVAMIFSLEVTPKVLALQFACEIAGVPYWNYSRGKVTEEEIQRVVLASGSDVFRNVAVYNRTNVSALDVSLAVTQLKAKGRRVVGVFVDYLGLMRHDKSERNDLAIAATTRLLKQIAIEKQVPVVLLAQLNREVEKRGTADECDRPRLADLRDSGSIEQDADNVIFLWRKKRDEEYKIVEPRTLTVAKHRNGQAFEMDLMFNKAKGRFYEVDERGEALAPPAPEWVSK